MGEALNKIDKVFGKIETGVNTVVERHMGTDIDLSNKTARNQYINYLQAQALHAFGEGTALEVAEAKRFANQASYVRQHFRTMKSPMVDSNNYTFYRSMRSDKAVPMNFNLNDIDGMKKNKNIALAQYISQSQAERAGQELRNGYMALGTAGVSILAAGHMFFGEDDDQ